ncbi:hypothetical protein, partial [Methylicorpusculum sp.]
MKEFTWVMLFLASTNALATTTYTCTFDSFSDDEGKHGGELLLTCLVDEAADKAYIIGNNGSNEVV